MRGTGTAADVDTWGDRLRARNDVPGHSRVRRTSSIGMRLLLPVVAASVGLIVGGAVILSVSTTAARQAHRAKTLADASAAIFRLVDHIEQEVAETNALRERGGTAGAQLLQAQRTRTDRALASYIQASEAALAEASGIRRAVGHVTRLLDPFAKARTAALDSDVDVSGFGDAFEQITHHLLDLASAIAEQVNDQRLGNMARTAAGLSELKHVAAEQRDLLRAAFLRGQLTHGELVRLAELYGDEQSRMSEVTHIATDTIRQRFTEAYVGPDVEASRAFRDAVLTSGGAPSSLAVDPDEWYIAQSGAMRQLRGLQLALVEELAASAARHETDAERRAILTSAIALIIVLGTLGGGAYLAVRTASRLRRLHSVALTVARGELPTAVAQVAGASDSDVVRDVMGASHRRVGTMLDPGRDEVGEVSSAVGVVHQQALRLAAEQALLRLEVSALFVALSRRGQSLVLRQLQLIDEFEQAETDPDTLARLFALDHLAARMRRNEENLLVLSGGEPGRRFDRPVVLTDVVRAASAEIEDYARVDAPLADDVWIAAHAVGDVTHLIAELLDNATAFSPPQTRVRVYAQRDGDGVALSIVDSGIGMAEEQLAEANRRLSQPSGLTATLVGTMGLLVVARLAARRGVTVHLRRGSDGGTVADARLPRDVLTAAPVRTLAPAPRLAPALSLPPAVTAAVRPDMRLAGPPAVPLPVAPGGAAWIAERRERSDQMAPSGGAWTDERRERSDQMAPSGGAWTDERRERSDQMAPGGAAWTEERRERSDQSDEGRQHRKSPAPARAEASAGGSAPARAEASAGGSAPARAEASASNSAASAGVMAAVVTPAGLPVRRPGTHGVTTTSARSGKDDMFLDPETVRARLSSLAGGIAAARRRETGPGVSSME